MDVVFTQAFLHRLLPYKHEVTLNAMRHLDLAAYKQHAPIAGLAALLASLLLYALGIWLRRMPAEVSTESQQQRIKQLHAVANGWLPWVLILSPTPIGGVLIVAAGFFAMRPWLAFAVIVAAEIAWRASPLL